MKTLWIASDHAGFALKQQLIESDAPQGWTWGDLGPASAERCDYPDFAEKLALKIQEAPDTLGVLVCGSGIGMAIAANKVPGVRATVVENTVAARLSREHNAVNVLCLGARFVAPEYAKDLIHAWIEARPSSDSRHQNRIAKIRKIEADFTG